MTTMMKAQIDIEFTCTGLYRKYIQFYGLMEALQIGPNIECQLSLRHVFPIQFTPLSPIYFTRIIKNGVTSSVTSQPSLQIQVFIRHIQYKKCNAKKIVGEHQLLLSNRYLIIPKTIYISLILLTQLGQWNIIPILRDDILLKHCLVEIMTITEYCNYSANYKCKQLNLPFRRLPGSLSFQQFNKIAQKLTNNLEIKDLLIPKNFVTYWKGHFNLNSSLCNIRTHASLNGAIKMDELNKPEIIREHSSQEFDSRQSNRSSRKKRGRPSFRKEIDNNSDNMDKSSKTSSKQSHLENNEESIAGDIKPLIDRSLRKRKQNQESDNTDKLSNPPPLRTRNHRKESNTSNEDQDKEDVEYNYGVNSQPRRSSRRIAIISSKKNEQSSIINNNNNNNNKNEGEEVGSKSSETFSQSDYAKKNIRPGTFKKKAVEVLSRWRTEEDFKVEYNAFYHSTTNHMPRIPKMGWLEVDIYKLFKITILKGGYHEVTKKLLWKDVYKSLNNTNIVSNAATTIRSHYRKLLLNFEDSIFRPKEKDINDQFDKNGRNSSLSKDAKRDGGPHSPIDQFASSKTNILVMKKYKEFTIDSILNPLKEHSESAGSNARYSDIFYPTGPNLNAYENTPTPQFDEPRRPFQYNREGPPFPGYYEYQNNIRPNYYGPQYPYSFPPSNMDRLPNPEFQHRPFIPPMYEPYDQARNFNPNGYYPHPAYPPLPYPPQSPYNRPQFSNGYIHSPYEHPPMNYPPYDRFFAPHGGNMCPPFNPSTHGSNR